VKGQVNISESTYMRIKDFFETEHRGQIMAKNKGAVDMYFVKRIKPELSGDDAGREPNQRFREMYRARQARIAGLKEFKGKVDLAIDMNAIRGR
jgi:hypothetical protein